MRRCSALPITRDCGFASWSGSHANRKRWFGRAHRTAFEDRSAQEWAQLYTLIFPPYQLLIESYAKAQEVVTNNEQLDSARG